MRNNSTYAKKWRAIGLKEGGLSNRTIASITGLSKDTVKRAWEKFLRDGKLDRKEGSGRPKLSDPRGDRRLKLIALRDRFQTFEDLRYEWAVQNASGGLLSKKLYAVDCFASEFTLGLRVEKYVLRPPMHLLPSIGHTKGASGR